jgi:hypothetical protein
VRNGPLRIVASQSERKTMTDPRLVYRPLDVKGTRYQVTVEEPPKKKDA